MAPRGRPPAPKTATRYLNSKRRVIYETADGKFVVKSAKGTTYNPKVAFVKSPGGTERKLANTKARPPTAIRPKGFRRPRVNRGVARGARAGPHVGNLPALFGPGPVERKYLAALAAKPRGRPRKVAMSPMWNLPNPHLRKVRKNKGVARPHARGPRGPQKKKQEAMFARLTAPLN